MLFFVTREWAILTTQTRDIQCEKFIEHETVSHEQCNSMYPNIYLLFICLLHKIN